MFEFIKKQSPVRVIALGFALVILLQATPSPL